VTVLAHGGGVPETLSILVPLALVVVFLRIGAKKVPPEEPSGEDSTTDDQQET
jgi:hypothetical protein